jgi:hypothetical protein
MRGPPGQPLIRRYTRRTDLLGYHNSDPKHIPYQLIALTPKPKPGRANRRHTDELATRSQYESDVVEWSKMAAMKSSLTCLSIALICSTSVFAQTWRDEQARLCFVRPENNGRMNTVESWIRVADYNVPVIGGQAVCLYAQPGDTELTVTSRDAYNPQSKNDEACKSRTLKFSMSGRDNRTFMICPATKGNAYACGWRIAEGSVKPNSGCNDN